MHYKIKEVSEKTGLSSHTLRYYEKEGILPPIDRDASGNRMYSQENITWLEIVKCLKQTNMPVADIKEIVHLSIVGDETIEERKEILLSHRKTIEEQMKALKKSLKKIDSKIAYYNGEDMC